MRALTWALDQHVPLASPLRDRWLLLPYERMVTQGEAELGRVCAHLGLEPTERARALLRTSSREAHDWSADHARADIQQRLGAWRARLRPEQIRRILDVIETVGIRGWSEALEPDYGALGATS